jgi:ribonuclease HI
MPWQPFLLRGDRVLVEVNEDGAPASGPDGRVDILYKEGGKVYRAAVRNLSPDPSPERLDSKRPAGAGVAKPVTAADTKVPAVIVYTDGACTGNPGPMGIGIVILDGKERKEISEYLGEGTNNIAELTAILRALERCPRDRPILLHSDSSYALGLLGRGWKAKANQALVAELRALAGQFPQLRLIKVEGHAGVPENERCDALARQAIATRHSR